MALTSTLMKDCDAEGEGQRRERECHAPRSRMRSKESLKLGNLKGNSLAVRREQKIRPLAQVDNKP